jgi:hypothetical protein
MKFEKLKVGMTVYSVGTYGVGNTTLRSVGVWPVVIMSIDRPNRTCTASWNHNKQDKFYESNVATWRVKMPLTINVGLGQYRLANRNEIAAAKAQEKAQASCR